MVDSMLNLQKKYHSARLEQDKKLFKTQIDGGIMGSGTPTPRLRRVNWNLEFRNNFFKFTQNSKILP